LNIAILLSAYNGSQFVKQLLESLFAQSYSQVEIIVRDDVSKDDTLDILRDYNVKLLPPTTNLGSKHSFVALLNYAMKNSTADYFMLCDQDDVWYADKVEKTLAKMKFMQATYGTTIPLLVHTDLEVVDESLQTIASSMWKYEHISPNKNAFSRLLIQNTITGSTVMINRALAERCLTIPNDAIMHDWWLGLVASQFGKIGFIAKPTIKYRQHSNNSIGAKKYKLNFYLLLKSLFVYLFRSDRLYLQSLQPNIDQARCFLQLYRSVLDDDSIKLLQDFVSLPEKSFVMRRIIIIKHRLLKNSFINNVALLLKI
jgi:glycosyltransferase involved in cell wall biosynthesis